jgi:hypothetical protein
LGNSGRDVVGWRRGRVEKRGMVLKMCDVLIKSHDWRSVINEKERKGTRIEENRFVYPEDAEVKRNDISSWGFVIRNANR